LTSELEGCEGSAPRPRKKPGTHCIGGWVGLRAGLDRSGNLASTGIRSPERPAHRQSLYRLRYPENGHMVSSLKEHLVCNIRNVWCLTTYERTDTTY